MLNLHYLPETITCQVGDGSDVGVRVRYSYESPVLGSAGGPRKALPLLPDDNFFIINGDTLTTVDLQVLADDHRRTGALVTVAVIPNEWPDKYGGLVLDSAGRFHSVVPPGSSVRSYHVVGVQLARPAAFAELRLDEPAESIGGHYRVLVKRDRGAVRACLCPAEFWDIGTPADYLHASLAIGNAEGRALHIGSGSSIDPSARVTGCIIWDDVTVGPEAVLHRCVVADGVTIPARARFQDSVIVQTNGQLTVVNCL